MKAAWRRDLLEVYRKSRPTSPAPGRWEGEGGQPVEPGAAKPEPAAAAADPGFDGVDVQLDGKEFPVQHGSVVIAAITSCTNTSNPSVMIAAGLVAKKAVEKGLTVPPHVKTSLAPGSRVVTDYFEKAGLDKYLDQIGFNTVGYGCTTCIGNSGPLPEPIAKAVNEHDLVVAGVLSRQSQLRGPHQSAREGELPRQPAAGRGLRPGRHDRHRPGRPSRSAPAREGQPVYLTRHLADARRGDRRSSTPACCPRCSRRSTTTSGRRTPSGTPSR